MKIIKHGRVIRPLPPPPPPPEWDGMEVECRTCGLVAFVDLFDFKRKCEVWGYYYSYIRYKPKPATYCEEYSYTIECPNCHKLLVEKPPPEAFRDPRFSQIEEAT
jgi:hypothetical protein